MRMYEENEAEMCNALASDLRKSKQESMVNEIDFLKNDLRNTLMNLRSWAAPETVRGGPQTLALDATPNA